MRFSIKKILTLIGIVLLAIISIGLVCLLLMNMGVVISGFREALAALRSIVLGFVMAYLLYPLTRFTEHFLLYHKVKKRVARVLSTAFATFLLLLMIFLFIYFVIPQLLENLPVLVQNLPWMIRNAFNHLTEFLQSHGQSTDFLDDISAKITSSFNAWVGGDLIANLMSLLGRVVDVAKSLLNFVIGIIVMVYVLMSRDRFVGQGKKLLFALCRKQSTCDTILKHLGVINQIFSGFVSGKLLDSFIIGILCGVGLSILNIPYPMLISVIVGVTNIIPVFGPFFGAIPSALLLLLTDPGKCLVFLIFIIILQQVDGNIIGPKVLGDSTGLSAFWVLFSLLLFNHLMGFWGMLLGVPLFASFYYLLREFINSRLRKKNLPESTDDYIHAVGRNEDGSIHISEPKRIQFYPLFKGDDSYLSQLKRWLERPFSKLRDKDDGSTPPTETDEDPDDTADP